MGGVTIECPTQEPIWGPTCSQAQVQVVQVVQITGLGDGQEEGDCRGLN